MGRKEAVLLCLKLECNHSVLPIKLGFALPHSPVKPAGQTAGRGEVFSSLIHSFPLRPKGAGYGDTKV